MKKVQHQQKTVLFTSLPTASKFAFAVKRNHYLYFTVFTKSSRFEFTNQDRNETYKMSDYPQLKRLRVYPITDKKRKRISFVSFIVWFWLIGTFFGCLFFLVWLFLHFNNYN